MNRSRSTIAKLTSLFLYGQYFFASCSSNLSTFLTLASPVHSSKRSVLRFTVRFMALQAYRLLRTCKGSGRFAERSSTRVSLHCHVSFWRHSVRTTALSFHLNLSIQLKRWKPEDSNISAEYKKRRDLRFSTGSWVSKYIIHLFRVLRWSVKMPFVLPRWSFQESGIDVLRENWKPLGTFSRSTDFSISQQKVI